MGVWLGIWEGELLRETAPWLRLYDRAGNLILLPEEREYQRADRQREEKERALAALERERQTQQALRLKLQELGIDADGIG